MTGELFGKGQRTGVHYDHTTFMTLKHLEYTSMPRLHTTEQLEQGSGTGRNDYVIPLAKYPTKARLWSPIIILP